jgi:hypothetical protein
MSVLRMKTRLRAAVVAVSMAAAAAATLSTAGGAQAVTPTAAPTGMQYVCTNARPWLIRAHWEFKANGVDAQGKPVYTMTFVGARVEQVPASKILQQKSRPLVAGQYPC